MEKRESAINELAATLLNKKLMIWLKVLRKRITANQQILIQKKILRSKNIN
jgi:hypothetical protein